jgi:hypothetical protein
LYGAVELVTGYIKNNWAEREYSGGGLYSTGTRISGAMVIENNIAEADFSGGGVYDAYITHIQGQGAIIRNNEALGANSGGGVSLCSEKGGYWTDIEYTTIQNNIAKGQNSGGGIYIHDPNSPPISIELVSGVIKGNRAEGVHSAGAIYINRGSLKMLNRSSYYESIIGGTLPGDANIADNGVNGVYIGEHGFFSMKESVIQGNTGGNNNYGVYVDNSEVEAFVMVVPYSSLTKIAGKVFLTDDAAITLQGNNNPNNIGIMADIICKNLPEEGTTKLLSAYSTTILNNHYNKFLYDGKPISVPIINGPTVDVYYGIYDGVESP